MKHENKLKRRFGRLRISADLISNTREGTMTRIMGMLIVFRAEHLFHENIFEYIAYSHRFREIEEGEIAPEYQIAIFQDGDIQFIETTRGYL